LQRELFKTAHNTQKEGTMHSLGLGKRLLTRALVIGSDLDFLLTVKEQIMSTISFTICSGVTDQT